MSHYLVPVKPPPVTPVPAATVVVLRDRPVGAFEILLIRRHTASKFAAGDFVFPGGRIEADDAPDGAAAWCRGLDAARAARALGLEAPANAALGHWVGAIRETFEEVGLLLAYTADGRPARLDDERHAAYRRACQRDHRAFVDMIRAERLTLATDRLVYFAHWITPVVQPLRFDTRFFAAVMPPAQTPVPDEHEIVAVRWLAPAEAAAARERGEIGLRLPTLKSLMLFDGAPSAAEAIDGVVGRTITAIRPRLVIEDGQRRAILPGEPGYH